MVGAACIIFYTSVSEIGMKMFSYNWWVVREFNYEGRYYETKVVSLPEGQSPGPWSNAKGPFKSESEANANH